MLLDLLVCLLLSEVNSQVEPMCVPVWVYVSIK